MLVPSPFQYSYPLTHIIRALNPPQRSYRYLAIVPCLQSYCSASHVTDCACLAAHLCAQGSEPPQASASVGSADGPLSSDCAAAVCVFPSARRSARTSSRSRPTLGRTPRGVRRPRPALERDSLVFTNLPTNPRRLCNVRRRARLSAALFARPGRSLSRGGGLPACAVGGRLRPLSQAVRRVAGAHCDATRRYPRAQSYSRPRNSALWSAPRDI